MAINTMTYYSNSIQGVPGVGADINLLRVDTSPKYFAGMLVERADGNRYRYCHIGTAAKADTLVGPTTATGGATYGAVVVVAPASAQTVPQEYPITAGSVGSHYVEVTVAGILANKYQGSYLVTTEGTGVGHTYRIIGNTATGSPASGNLRLQLAEPIQVALTATTGTIIVASMYTDLANCATSATQVIGVLKGTVGTAPGWAWVQTRGVTGCQDDGLNTPAAGDMIVPSTSTGGAYGVVNITSTVFLASAFAQPYIGYVITPGGNTVAGSRQGVVYLEIE